MGICISRATKIQRRTGYGLFLRNEDLHSAFKSTEMVSFPPKFAAVFHSEMLFAISNKRDNATASSASILRKYIRINGRLKDDFD